MDRPPKDQAPPAHTNEREEVVVLSEEEKRAFYKFQAQTSEEEIRRSQQWKAHALHHIGKIVIT